MNIPTPADLAQLAQKIASSARAERAKATANPGMLYQEGHPVNVRDLTNHDRTSFAGQKLTMSMELTALLHAIFHEADPRNAANIDPDNRAALAQLAADAMAFLPVVASQLRAMAAVLEGDPDAYHVAFLSALDAAEMAALTAGTGGPGTLAN